MKHKWVSTIAFGIVCSIFVILLNGEITTDNIISGLLQGLLIALSIKIAVPLIVNRWLGNVANRLDAVTPSPTKGEIVCESRANLFDRKTAFGGKIFLTNEYIIFNSHGLNLKKKKVKIAIKEISTIDKWVHKQSSVTDNGLVIRTTRGNEFKFAVDHRDNWLERLNGLPVNVA